MADSWPIREGCSHDLGYRQKSENRSVCGLIVEALRVDASAVESLRLTREEGLQQDTEDEQRFKMQESEEDHSKETEKEEAVL